MPLADWFKPKWKHSDPRVRLVAVAQGIEQDALAQLAQNDHDEEVALAATERVTDPAVLINIAKRPYRGVALAAAERVMDEHTLADIASRANDWFVAVTCAERVTNPALLAQIATNSSSEDAQLAALERVVDKSALADIARKDGISISLRTATIEYIVDEGVLIEIAKSDHAPTEVRQAAIARLTDKAVLSGLAARHPNAGWDDINSRADSRLKRLPSRTLAEAIEDLSAPDEESVHAAIRDIVSTMAAPTRVLEQALSALDKGPALYLDREVVELRREVVLALARRGAARPVDLRGTELLCELSEGYTHAPGNHRALRAAIALGTLSGPRAVAALTRSLRGDWHGFRKEVRIEAAKALERIGDPAAIAPMVEALNDKDMVAEVRAAISTALNGIRAAGGGRGVADGTLPAHWTSMP